MSFYQQSTISLYSWFLLVFSCIIFLMTFHGSNFLNIKLGPTTTSSRRRRGRGLHNPDSAHDHSVLLIGWGQKFHQHHDRISCIPRVRWLGYSKCCCFGFSVFVFIPCGAVNGLISKMIRDVPWLSWQWNTLSTMITFVNYLTWYLSDNPRYTKYKWNIFYSKCKYPFNYDLSATGCRI